MSAEKTNGKLTLTWSEIDEIIAALEGLHWNGDAVIHAATSAVLLSPHAKAAQIARAAIWDRDAGKGVRRIEVTNANYSRWASDLDAVNKKEVEVEGLHIFEKKDLNRDSFSNNPNAPRLIKILAIHGLLKLE